MGQMSGAVYELGSCPMMHPLSDPCLDRALHGWLQSTTSRPHTNPECSGWALGPHVPTLGYGFLGGLYHPCLDLHAGIRPWTLIVLPLGPICWNWAPCCPSTGIRPMLIPPSPPQFLFSKPCTLGSGPTCWNQALAPPTHIT